MVWMRKNHFVSQYFPLEDADSEWVSVPISGSQSVIPYTNTVPPVTYDNPKYDDQMIENQGTDNLI